MDYLIKNALLINENRRFTADVRVKGNFIHTISSAALEPETGETIINATGKYLIPGAVDDQVHFREPGSHTKPISIPKAAPRGGEASPRLWRCPIPTCKPLTQELLAQKYGIGSEKSLGRTTRFLWGLPTITWRKYCENRSQKRVRRKGVHGLFHGQYLLVDDQQNLEGIFRECPMLIALHCEKEAIIRENLSRYQAEYPKRHTGNGAPPFKNPQCRGSVTPPRRKRWRWRKNTARIHILHISTARETALFRQRHSPFTKRKSRPEACIYLPVVLPMRITELHGGNFIKWNPAVKSAADREKPSARP